MVSECFKKIGVGYGRTPQATYLVYLVDIQLDLFETECPRSKVSVRCNTFLHHGRVAQMKSAVDRPGIYIR